MENFSNSEHIPQFTYAVVYESTVSCDNHGGPFTSQEPSVQLHIPHFKCFSLCRANLCNVHSVCEIEIKFNVRVRFVTYRYSFTRAGADKGKKVSTLPKDYQECYKKHASEFLFKNVKLVSWEDKGPDGSEKKALIVLSTATCKHRIYVSEIWLPPHQPLNVCIWRGV